MIRIEYEDLPYGANENAVFTSNDAQSISDFSTATATKYVTMEPNMWLLNGSYQIPATSNHKFFWSTRESNSSGEWATPPTITVTLDSPVTSTGLTFNFDNELYEFDVDYYLENVAVRNASYVANSPNYVALDYVDGWDKIIITFTKSINPYRLVKLNSFVIGQFITFEPNELVSVSAVAECSPIGDELPIGTLDFTLKDLHNRVLNFQNRQRLLAYQNNALVGVYFIDTSKRSSRIDYDISCVDSIGVLDKATYYGGIYNSKNARTLIAEIVGNDAEVDYTNVSGTITGYLPICSKRDALNQVALALNLVVTTYGVNKISFYTLAETQESVINEDRIFSADASVETTSRISAVNVTYHTYVMESNSSQAYKGTINGINTVTFNEPYGNYSITGGTIIDSGANYATVNGSGEVTITGRKYVDNKVIATKLNPRTSVQDKNNIIEITDATLVNADNVNSVLNNVYNYSLFLSTIRQSIIVDDEYPSKMVSSVNVYGNRVFGYITKMNLTFTRNTYADIELVGNEVDKSTHIAPEANTMQSGEELWL